MRNLYLILLFFPIFVFSQVGIGTQAPTAMLDVNGNMRIRTTPTTTEEVAAKDYILVANTQGNIERVTSKQVVESHFKTFVKGSFSNESPALINLAITGNSYSTIPFNKVDFDLNQEFNITNYTFTAKQTGLYSINVAIRVNSSVLSISGDFGVAIYKEEQLQARNTFANIQLLGLNITPSVRSVQTLVQLNATEKITFRAFSGGGLTAGILSNGDESFFTIQQVR